MRLEPTTLTQNRIIELFPHLKHNADKIAELVEYAKDLEILSKNKISIQFNNSGKEHAAIVMSKIFETSNNRIRMFSGNFNGNICDNELYQASLTNYLNLGKNIEIVFEEEPNRHSKTFNMLVERSKVMPNQIKLLKATPTQLEKLKTYLVNKNQIIHFAIGDNEAGEYNKYRCETDTKNYIAILNFDDIKFSSKLNNLFDILNLNASVLN